jgi:hypothetical protein
MKTAFYWPAYLGPLGQQADFWAVTNLLLETLTASEIELFLDTEPSRPALARLFTEIRKGQVNRVIIRSLSDLCLTTREFGQFLSDVTEHRVKVEQIFGILPSVLLQGQPELLGRFRHRQLMAKIIRLRSLGLKISEICSLIRATPQQVYRILSRPR